MRSPTSFSRSLAPMLLGTLLVSGPALAADGPDSVPLIPRDTLFGNPDRAGVQVSPDGSRISWIAPLDGVLNVWVAPVGDVAAAKAVTKDTDRGIRQYF